MPKGKEIRYGQDARKAIKAGVDKTANAVKVTLGPTGRTVIMDRGWGAPSISDDGVTVAKNIELKDLFENVGAALVQEVANQTNEKAGDGTSTATVLAQAMIAQAFEQISVNARQATQIKAGMEKALVYVKDRLKELAKPIDTQAETEQVAIISSLDAEVGKLIAEAMEDVGRDGVITIEEGQTIGLEKEIVSGMRFNEGFTSPYFVSNQERNEAVVEDPYILLTDRICSNVQELIPLLEQVVKSGRKGLVVVATDITGDALASLILNKVRGVLNVVCVKAPGHSKRSEYLQDLAILTGATVITEEMGKKLSSVTLEDLGHARKVVSTQEHTTVIEGKGEKTAIDGRIAELKNRIDETKVEYEKHLLRERIAKLSGGIGVIKVGAFTETELRTRKYKIEDALNATRAAVEEGIVIGGGAALAKIAGDAGVFEKAETPAEVTGADIVMKSLTAPLLQMAENAGLDAIEVLSFVRTSDVNSGYDFKSCKPCNLMETGIIDPVKVTRMALENAVSIASTVITSEAVIVDESEEKKEDSANKAF